MRGGGVSTVMVDSGRPPEFAGAESYRAAAKRFLRTCPYTAGGPAPSRGNALGHLPVMCGGRNAATRVWQLEFLGLLAIQIARASAASFLLRMLNALTNFAGISFN